jgi:response regulator RpfG family c-di-GMP phosphodiesterase
MPGLLGTELLSQVRDRWPNVIRVCMSGHADRDEIVSAINGGEVFRFLLKPWSLEAFDSTLRDAVREADVLAEHVAMQRMLHQQNERLRTLQGDMDRAVEERARELHLRQACTEEALLQALSALRRGDGEMVSTFAVAIGERLGISPNDMGTLRLGVALRDVMGRLGKPIDAGRGAPSPAALARVVEACQARADLAALVRGMDARWDGSGEGSGPRGATIPLPARIARIAETAVGRLMAGDSPSNAQIAAALRAESGTSLDPDLVGPAATLVELGALRRIVDEGTREPSPAAPVYVAGPFSGAAG